MKLFMVLAFLVVSALAVELPITDLPEWWAHRGLAMPQNRAGRIVGGNEAREHQFPYQVGLRLFIRDSTNVGLCGGSFLTQTRVLSAAHCVDVVSGVESVFGAHVMNNVNEPNQQRRTTPESGLIWHAEYDPQSLVNDVAIIHLLTPVIPNAFIQTVRLPEGADLTNEFNGEIATASGWGRFSSENVASSFLRFVEVNVMTNTLCRVRFPTLIADSTLCTSGVGGVGACNGDSGGPLTLQRDGQSTVIGIASFALTTNCEAGWPTGWVRVTSFHDWIRARL